MWEEGRESKGLGKGVGPYRQGLVGCGKDTDMCSEGGREPLGPLSRAVPRLACGIGHSLWLQC